MVKVFKRQMLNKDNIRHLAFPLWMLLQLVEYKVRYKICTFSLIVKKKKEKKILNIIFKKKIKI